MIFFLLSAEIFFIFFIIYLFLYFLIILFKMLNQKNFNKYNVFLFFKILCFLSFISFFQLKINNPVTLQFFFDLFFYSTNLMVFIQSTFSVLFIIFFLFFSKIEKDYLYFFEILFLILNIFFLSNLIFIVNDFFFFFILFEGISLSIYILSMISLSSLKTAEAGLKYFLYGVFVSIFLLISILGLYYLYGTVIISKIILFQEQDFFNNFIFNMYINKYIYFISIFFFFCCLLFKIGIVPFHLQVIDMYSSIIFSIFFFFMIITKFLSCVLLFKSVFIQFKFNNFYYFIFFFFCGFSSIIISSFGVLYEINIRRILAQSSINHMGFLCLLCLSGSVLNIISYLFYLYIYLCILIFFFIGQFFIKQENIYFETLFDLSYIFKISKILGFFFCFIFFMMAGLPPFLGFQIKWVVFQSFSLQFNFFFYLKFILLFLLLLFNIINIYIYLRFIMFLFSDTFGFLFLKNKFLILFNFLFLFNYISLQFCKFLFNYIFQYIFNMLIYSNFIL